MHNLSRLVRFSINPFLPEDKNGFNSFASRPAGEGLAIFFELCVKLAGEVEPATGLIVNVSNVDEQVREYVVPEFSRQIRKDFRQGSHIGLFEVTKLLKSAWGQLADKFGEAKLKELNLSLNPFRKVGIDSEDCKMSYFSEKFEFAATHKLWNDNFSDQRNREVFGKCANPSGHGHNYIVEVMIRRPADKRDFSIGDFEKVVDNEFIKVVDHKNLNIDVPYFARAIPTVENIATFAWESLSGKFGEAVLHCVTIWETDKTYCSYYG
ncbi:MAG: 6-carboxytetrahydropterin synthase [Sedimentisphaerales bacterium]|nr:6-carboxytetrahydropterin synthase [Sedimentisphaerales bacterium]